MMKAVETSLERLQDRIEAEFPDVRLEFSFQLFENHAEIWVYVLDLSRYEAIRAWCRELAQDGDLDNQEPAIWIIVRTWSGPWEGGESEQELRQRQREDFRRRHGIGAGG